MRSLIALFVLCVPFTVQAEDPPKAEPSLIRSRVVDSSVSLQLVHRGGHGMSSAAAPFAFPAKLIHLDKIFGLTQTVRCSGTFIFHGEGDKKRALILTCAHCVEPSKRIIKKLEDGKEKKIVAYDDAQFSYTVVRNGRKVGEVIGVAKVLACGASEEDGGDDLALLEAYDADMGKGKAKLLPEGKVYDIGAPAWNCSTLWGEFSHSLLNGIVSSRGFMYENKSFDTTNLSVRPGSSGSGYHVVVDGEPYLAGVISRWDGKGSFGMAVSIERVRPWLRSVGYGFLIGDPEIKDKAK